MATEPILVVDDEASLRNALGRVLRRMGYETVQADSGEAGIDMLGKKNFSCAITDLRMPGMGGHGFIKQAKEMLPNLPIIVMSGNGDMQDVISCLREGAADFIVKPWEDDYLKDLIAKVCQPRSGDAEEKPQAAQALAADAKVDAAASAAPVSGSASIEAVVARIRAREIPAPVQPKVALLARMAAAGENASAKLRNILETNAEMASRVLGIANSTYYGGYGKVTNLGAAISLIGVREISNFIDTIAAYRFHTMSGMGLKPQVDACWQHSLMRAVVMRFLSQEARTLGVTPADAYLAGLFCDSGAAFLYKLLGEMKDDPEGLAAHIAEHHSALGIKLAESWQLPAICVEACKRHHDKHPTASHIPILKLIWAAEPICLAIGSPGDPVPLDMPGALAAIGVNPTAVSRVQMMVRTYITAHEPFIVAE
jgi:FixJ family two-component response regulator/HD-like signal output (HDOD) protein